MEPLLLTLNELPPSVNDMYIHTKFGPKLSAHARKFFARAHMALAAQMRLGTVLDPSKAYHLRLRFRLPVLENAGWPNTKTRFKTRDVSNLVKVTEDVIAHVLNINDSNFIAEQFHKVWSEQPGVDIVVTEFMLDGEPYTSRAPAPRLDKPWCPSGPEDYS